MLAALVSVMAQFLPDDGPGQSGDFRVSPTFFLVLLGQAGYAMMTSLRGASNAKAKRELGWTPAYPSWRQGFAAL